MKVSTRLNRIKESVVGVVGHGDKTSRFCWKAGNTLATWTAICVSRTTLLHAVT